MKNILTLIVFFAVVVNVSSQGLDQKERLANQLLEVTKVKQMVPMLVNSIIGKVKSQNKQIPASYWKKIEEGIEYKNFINGCKELFVNNYSEEGLKELIALYTPATMEQYKAKTKIIEPELYKLGNKFGQNTIMYITNKVKEYK